MKKAFLFWLAAVLYFPLTAQNNANIQPGLSPLTKHYLQEIKKTGRQPDGYVYKTGADGQNYISALIQVSDASLAQSNLQSIGAAVGTKAGNIWTVQVPVDQVQPFTTLGGIRYIQLDEPVFPLLNIARKTTRVDSAHSGIGLPMPYSGKDVVIGVIDFGFDYNHPTFYDTLGNIYRVKQVWELNSVGTPPAGYVYGHEITDTSAIKLQGTDNPQQTHGTGVTGIAGGSGYGSANNNRFRGMAYEADLVFVGVRRDSIGEQWMQSGFSDFLDGVQYIFDYAQTAGKPAVVNISWGSQSGPHDGSSLFNQACNNLSGAGRIIVMSAGNEGEERIHLSKTFTPADTAISTFLTFTSPAYQRTWVDVWGDTAQTFCAKVTLYDQGNPVTTTGMICIDDAVHNFTLIGANGNDTCFVQLITASSEFNQKPRITANIFNRTADSVGVTIQGTAGSIDMWDEYYYYGYTYGYQSAFSNLGQPWASTGNTKSTVSDMGAAESVLLVGAYASKVNFSDINGNSWSYSGYVLANRLVPFSSRGPMIDGRIKPDITAPGLTLGTAISSYDTDYTPTGASSDLTISRYIDPLTTDTFYYAEFSGTSASSPAAAGIVALLLQADPTLTPQEIKDVLFYTAILDNYTGSLPPEGNNNWGHGKINAYGALKYLAQSVGLANYSDDNSCYLYPNPNDGVFNLHYLSKQSEEVKLEVADLTGKIVWARSWAVTEGVNQYPFDLSAFSGGLYFIRLTSGTKTTGVRTLIR